VRSCLGGCANDKIQTMISTDIKILAGRHPLPATCLQVHCSCNSTSLYIKHARAYSGKSVSHHHHHSPLQRTERQQMYRHTGMTKMDWVTGVTEMDEATGSIYLGDPRVDRFYIILSYNESHTLSFASFDLNRSLRDFVDPHGQVVSYLLTLFLRSSSQNRSFSRITIAMLREVQPSVDNGLFAF